MGGVGGQAVIGGCQIMGQLSHGPAITDDVMDGEAKNVIVATGTLQMHIPMVRQGS